MKKSEASDQCSESKNLNRAASSSLLHHVTWVATRIDKGHAISMPLIYPCLIHSMNWRRSFDKLLAFVWRRTSLRLSIKTNELHSLLVPVNRSAALADFLSTASFVDAGGRA